MNFIDLFSGIGGFRLGLEMAGHTCLGHCEKDRFANKAYIAMHHPREGEWFAEDIQKIEQGKMPKADMWCFGFPCQDISSAGKQLGLEGARSGLFYKVIEIIKGQKKEDKPSILLIENVKNLLSVNNGWDFAKILCCLDEAGYDAEWQVLNSKDFGVPQNRERIFIVGHFRGRSTKKVFPIRRCSSTASIEVIGATDEKVFTQNTHKRSVIYGTNGIMSCLTATDYKQPKQIMVGYIDSNSQGNRIYNSDGLSIALSANGGGRGGKTGLYTVRAVLTPDRINKRQNGRRFKEPGEPMFTLTAQDKHGLLITEATKKGFKEANEGDSIVPNSQTRRGRVGKGIANTLDTGSNQGVLMRGKIRRLTPKECFRLQGFPDEYFEKVRGIISETQLYKCAGNAVTVKVVYEIGKRLN